MTTPRVEITTSSPIDRGSCTRSDDVSGLAVRHANAVEMPLSTSKSQRRPRNYLLVGPTCSRSPLDLLGREKSTRPPARAQNMANTVGQAQNTGETLNYPGVCTRSPPRRSPLASRRRRDVGQVHGPGAAILHDRPGDVVRCRGPSRHRNIRLCRASRPRHSRPKITLDLSSDVFGQRSRVRDRGQRGNRSLDIRRRSRVRGHETPYGA